MDDARRDGASIIGGARDRFGQLRQVLLVQAKEFFHGCIPGFKSGLQGFFSTECPIGGDEISHGAYEAVAVEDIAVIDVGGHIRATEHGDYGEGQRDGQTYPGNPMEGPG